MTALLDHLHQLQATEVVQAFGVAPDAALGAWLEELSAALTALAYRHRREQLPGPHDPPERCVALMTAALQRHLPEAPEPRRVLLAELLVWSANGLLDGALHRADVTASTAALGVLAAWRGIIAGPAWKDDGP